MRLSRAEAQLLGPVPEALVLGVIAIGYGELLNQAREDLVAVAAAVEQTC